MSKYRKMAKGIEHFAKGVYSQMDNQAGAKLSKSMSKVSFKEMSSSQAYNAGIKVSQAVPFRGIMDSTREYYNYSNNGIKGVSVLKNSIIEGHKKNGQVSFGKVAGTAATIGVAGRIATGGGLYRDRYGNVNIPGLPFI